MPLLDVTGGLANALYLLVHVLNLQICLWFENVAPTKPHPSTLHLGQQTF